MNQIVYCPTCTFLNNQSNTNCDCCDSPLLLDNPTENDPLEDEFMQITGEPRSSAQNYLRISNKSLDNAVSLFYSNNEEQDESHNEELYNIFANALQSAFRREYQTPNNVKDLTCQLLYRRGRNEPHYCEMCDSRAYLVIAKVLIYKSNYNSIIRMISHEDLSNLESDSSKYNDIIKDILSIIDDFFLPKILENLNRYILDSYFNRDRLKKEDVELEAIEETMDYRNGPEFRIIWDILHQSKDKLDENEINEELKKLVTSEEFHSYLNQSWESPVYNHPASKDEISKLKKINLTKDVEEYKNLKDKKCSICMDEFLPDGREIIMLSCHTFCSKCILEWLENHNDTCPVCRKCINDKSIICKKDDECEKISLL